MNYSAGAAASATAAVPHVDVADCAGQRGQHGGSGFGAAMNSGLAGGVDSSRWRDLFPLPHAPLPVRVPGSSSSSRRRRCKVEGLVKETNEVIDVLNEVYAPPSDRVFPSMCSLAQQRSHHEIFKQLSKRATADSSCTAREAIEELLRSSPTYSSAELSTTVRVFNKDLVSIPTSQSEPVALSGVLDPVGRETIEDPLRCMMLSEDEWGQIIEKGDTFKPYMDVKLQHSSQEYELFVKTLFEAGMIDFTSEPQDLVTPFFVAKKDGRQRLILDCRGVNRRFRAPPSMSLAAGYTWSHLQLPSDKQLYVAQSDIKDYFYHLRMPEILQPLFCLPSINNALLRSWGVPSDRGGLSDREGLAFPMLRVVPMGWSWAMWIAQRVHQHQCLLASGLPSDRIMTDRRPVPSLDTDEPFVLPYADNLNVGGTNKDRVQEVKDKVVEHLRRIGFKVHEELDATTTCHSLGYLIDGQLGVVQPIPEKLRKVQLCFDWLARRPFVSGKAIEKILGHGVHFMLIRREILSLFRNLYDFAQRHRNGAGRLWRSAARESKWASILLRLCVTDLRRSWDSTVTASDASLSGIAICSREADQPTIHRLGSQKEGWRFCSYNPCSKPRENTVKKPDVFSDPSTVKPLSEIHHDPFCFNDEFEEIDMNFMNPEHWQLRYSVRMKIPEHITLLEGRGIVSALRHKLRSLSSFGKRHLHLGDNLASILIAEKGRASSYEMLRVSRRIACLLLAANCTLTSRWIPSEWNVADHGSRRWEAERKLEQSEKRKQQDFKETILYPNRHGAQEQRALKAFLAGSHGEESREDDTKLIATDTAGQDSSRKTRKESGHGKEPSTSSSVQRSNPLGTDGSLPSGCSRLSHSLQGVPRLQPCSKIQPEEREELRQGLHRVSQLLVHRRQRSFRSKQVLRSSTRCQPRLFRQAVFTPKSQKFAGMVKVRPGQHSASTGLGPCSLVVPGNASKRFVPAMPSNPPDVHCLLAPRGSSKPERRRSSRFKDRVGSHCHKLAPFRETGNLQGGADRRDRSSGFQGVAKPWKAIGRSSEWKQKRSPLSVGLCHHEASLGSTGKSGGNANWIPSVVSTTSLGSITRPPDESQASAGSEAKGEVGLGLIRSSLRKSCQSSSRISTTAYPDTGKGFGKHSTLGEGAPKVFLPAPEKDKKTWVIEVYAGSCHLSKAAAQAGYRALAIDIQFGLSCDILDSHVRRFIVDFASQHEVKLVWFGMPCQSWSRARRDDGGPPPLRDDDQFLWGRPNLGRKDQSKIELGNQLLLHTLTLIHQLRALHVPWALENPWSSRCWLVPEISTMLEHHTINLKQVDYCQFNTPWKKSTGVMFESCDLHSIFKVCKPVNGRCSATHRKHFILAGQDSAGQWLTHRAQPYPPQLCRSIIQAL